MKRTWTQGMAAGTRVSPLSRESQGDLEGLSFSTPSVEETPTPLTPGKCREVLDCGHTNYQTVRKPRKDWTPEEVRRSQAQGLLVGKEIEPTCSMWVQSAVDCRYCKGEGAHLVVPDYRSQKGVYRKPTPFQLRRTSERQGGMGWPGLCTDSKTGFYIGGIGNDCRYYHSGKTRCEVHSLPGKLPDSSILKPGGSILGEVGKLSRSYHEAHPRF